MLVEKPLGLSAEDCHKAVDAAAKTDWLPCDSGLVVRTAGRNIERLDLPSAGNVHLPLVRDFVDSILSDCEPVTNLVESAKANVLLDAVYRSARENVAVTIDWPD